MGIVDPIETERGSTAEEVDEPGLRLVARRAIEIRERERELAEVVAEERAAEEGRDMVGAALERPPESRLAMVETKLASQ